MSPSEAATNHHRQPRLSPEACLRANLLSPETGLRASLLVSFPSICLGVQPWKSKQEKRKTNSAVEDLSLRPASPGHRGQGSHRRASWHPGAVWHQASVLSSQRATRTRRSPFPRTWSAPPHVPSGLTPSLRGPCMNSGARLLVFCNRDPPPTCLHQPVLPLLSRARATDDKVRV
ncbi:hypothetical protein HJG60_007756 [Phyllostomus discolor]|uniref:Uncharacterized protein n=1 Tax=Phyllostomus discolor TaxID=89673 RepID=A0A834BJC3_9CHIR|nr:hypothetical protein HJG60_007756 [Phyllostomus discolor]